MPTTVASAPVFTVLTSMLEVLHPNNISEGKPETDKSFAVFSYRQHFEALWKMVGQLPPWLSNAGNEERTVVLVWDGLPESSETINVADYVTPFDWALALSWALFRSKTDSEGNLNKAALPRLRILILDLKSQEHPNALGVRTFTVAGRALPWVHVYWPVGNELLAAAALFEDPGNLAALRPALPPGSFDTDYLIQDVLNQDRLQALGDDDWGVDSRSHVKMLVELWRTSLTRAGDRHHVGNLLAPLLLVMGFPKKLRREAESKLAKRYPLRRALRVLAETLGLGTTERVALPPKWKAVPPGLLAELASEPDPFERKKKLRFLLVDDQYKLGFHHVLGNLLLGERYAGEGNTEDAVWVACVKETDNDGAPVPTDTLRCHANAEGLFNKLMEQPPVTDWSLPRHLDLDCDILLLDLRLWTNQKDKRELIAFVRRLLNVCRHLNVDSRIKCDRDQTFSRAYKAALAIEAGGQANELELLALLPLLLSYYDPSLPVILFSSTQQRSVVEMMAHRPNILTGFAKPILSGYGEERSAASYLSDLIEAIHRAISLHEARRLWKRIESMNWHKKPPQFITDNPDYDPFITDNPDYDPSAAALEPKLEYNTPGGRVAAPNLQGDVLRSALGSIYVKYIMNRQGFDFASVPWEFLERALTPHELMNRYEVYNPKFDLPDWLSKRNCLSRILQNARHKKAHGHATPPSTDQEQHEWDIASWLLYSCLLDFIAGETSPATDAREVQSIKDRLHARLLPGYTNRHPNYLTARDDVAWLPFVTYTMLWAILASKEARYNWTSKETRNAAKIVGEYAMTSISLKPVTT